MMELGKKIKQLRFKAGLTQEQLAEKLGIGPQSVSKWENAVSMPDITALPLLAEIFGISIDELFDLTSEQRLNRIENSLDITDELPQDLFREYEDFLKAQLDDEQNRQRATSLIAYLYWHRMNSCAKKAARYAKDVIRMDPGTRDCQWVLDRAEGHAAWDWNMSNHTKAIEFWRGIVEENPEDDPNLFVLEGNEIDLSEILATCFILDMETKFLCREDCKGLCPTCGKNLNLGPCSCRKALDPRFAVLEQLLDK